jgi:hypothetical protein
MRKFITLAVVVAVLAACAVAIVALNGRKNRKSAATFETDAAPLATNTGGKRVPVVVELFTSEGCSSCPPADDVLARLEREQPVAGAEVIALSQHVDYWNYLGWSDPYSSHDFSERQGEYAGVFGNSDVYTPQMIVDGHTEFPGSNNGKALDAITEAAREPKADVTIARAADSTNADSTDTDRALQLDVRVLKLPKLTDGDTADVLLAVTEDNLASDVARGENAGHKLTHIGVVRALSKIGYVGADTPPFSATPAVTLDKGWRRENLRAVVFLQEHTSKRVVGAASIKLFG